MSHDVDTDPSSCRRLALFTTCQELNIGPSEVEPLLVSLILDGRIDGLIDQVHQRLELTKPYVEMRMLLRRGSSDVALNRQTALGAAAPRCAHRSENAKLYTAADRWTKQLDRITTSVTNRVA